MSGTWRVLRAEIWRLVRVLPMWMTGLVLALVAGTTAWASHVRAIREGTLDPIESGRAWAPFVDGWRAGLVLGAFALLAFAARSVAGDRETGVVRLACTRSASRAGLVTGRLLLGPLLVLLVVLVSGLAAGIVAVQLGDLGAFVEDGYEILAREELVEEVRRAVLSILPGLFALYAFGLFVSCIARGATVAVTSALGAFVAFDLFKEALGEERYLVFASHVPTLADTSAWSELPGLVRGYSDAFYEDALLRAAWIVPWPALAAFLLAGILVLRRRPL